MSSVEIPERCVYCGRYDVEDCDLSKHPDADESCEGCGALPGMECSGKCPRERDLMDEDYPLSRGD